MVKMPSFAGDTASNHVGSYQEKLLCGACEAFLSKNYEHYAISMLTNKKASKVRAKRGSRFVRLSGVDCQRFHLFLLSVFWRVSVSNQEQFSNVDLTAELEEYFRLALLGSFKVTSLPYYIEIRRLESSLGLPVNDERLCREMLIMPFVRADENMAAISWVGMGFLYSLCITRAVQDKKDLGIAKKTGSKIYIPVINALSIKDIYECFTYLYSHDTEG